MLDAALSVWFAAGVFGGLLNAVFVWGTGRAGVNQMLGLSITPKWTVGFLYNKLVWGGIWGSLFYFVDQARVITLGVAFLVSLAPTAVQLFYVFPKGQKGTAGKMLGRFTWAYVIVANAVWGFGALWWYNATR